MFSFYRVSMLAKRVARQFRLWWYKLDSYWLSIHKDDFAFATVVGLSIGFISLMAYFAYAESWRSAAEQQRMADLGCLARNIYQEARGEPANGQQAVAEVTLNRVASNLFPDTVCEVVYEQRWDRERGRYVGAFSWTELDRVSQPRGIAWDHALEIAEHVYDDEHDALTDDALFYHATTIEPAWARSKTRVTKIGRHIFYE